MKIELICKCCNKPFTTDYKHRDKQFCNRIDWEIEKMIINKLKTIKADEYVKNKLNELTF